MIKLGARETVAAVPGAVDFRRICQVIVEPEKLAHGYFVKDVYLEPGQIVSTSVLSPLEGVLVLSRREIQPIVLSP